MATPAEPAAAVRSVQRAFALVRLMNRRDDWSLHQLATQSGLAKATVHRLLRTLAEERYVYALPGRPGHYRLTSMVAELSAGLSQATRRADAAEPIIMAATRSLGWPVSLAVADVPFMQVVACGMPHDPAHSAKPTSVGHRHWIFSSAVGNAFLSRCSDQQIAQCRDKAAAFRTADNLAPDLPPLEALIAKAREVQARGYAVRIANRADLNSAVAVPVLVATEVIGALACSTFPHSLSAQFINRIVAPLTDVAAQIAEACKPGAETDAAHGPADRAGPAPLREQSDPLDGTVGFCGTALSD